MKSIFHSALFRSSFVFVLCALVGWVGAYFAKPSQSSQFANFNAELWRNPAAISKTNDLSRLTGPELKKASRRQLLEDVRMIAEKNQNGVEQYGIELGHFVVKGPTGNKEFACEFYDRVHLQFVAEGTAVNGKLPELHFEGACGISKNINRMLPIWLPLEEIKNMPPRNLRAFYFENEKVFANAYHIADFWPNTWRLEAVKVFNEVKADREIAVESAASETYRSQPITVGW